MRRKATAIIALVEPKSIVFGLAVFNFMFIWVKSARGGGMGALVPPWYDLWSYTNEPSRLLLAALLLWLSRKWCYALACAISGYIVGQLVYIYMSFDVRPLHDLKRLLTSEDILAQWQCQHVLAFIIFTFGSFYLVRELMHILASQEIGVLHVVLGQPVEIKVKRECKRSGGCFT